MLTLDFHPSGRHFLQIPGPSPVPDRLLRAMSYPTIDHRGPQFGALGLKILEGIKPCAGANGWPGNMGRRSTGHSSRSRPCSTPIA
ncbi:MAG: hypothetical protein B7Y95_03565 [Rhizobiales bacterium 32-66-11]|jgi:aspartate aminotransferase-like enzyme|nr:MAG: hypothetical protein B7Y95_03565 [Rhizobiales bacterium 32-66-11]